MTSENLVTVAEGTLEQAEVVLRSQIEKLPVVNKDHKLKYFNQFRDITKLTQNPSRTKMYLVVYVATAIGVTVMQSKSR
jgi:IMP dehydrogenase